MLRTCLNSGWCAVLQRHGESGRRNCATGQRQGRERREGQQGWQIAVAGAVAAAEPSGAPAKTKRAVAGRRSERSVSWRLRLLGQRAYAAVLQQVLQRAPRRGPDQSRRRPGETRRSEQRACGGRAHAVLGGLRLLWHRSHAGLLQPVLEATTAETSDCRSARSNSRDFCAYRCSERCSAVCCSCCAWSSVERCRRS